MQIFCTSQEVHERCEIHKKHQNRWKKCDYHWWKYWDWKRYVHLSEREDHLNSMMVKYVYRNPDEKTHYLI